MVPYTLLLGAVLIAQTPNPDFRTVPLGPAPTAKPEATPAPGSAKPATREPAPIIPSSPTTPAPTLGPAAPTGPSVPVAQPFAPPSSPAAAPTGPAGPRSGGAAVAPGTPATPTGAAPRIGTGTGMGPAAGSDRTTTPGGYNLGSEPTRPAPTSILPSGPAAATAPAAAPTATAPAASSLRRTPPEMVADLLRLPEGSAVTGRAASLLDVLASARDRARQLETVHAYWRLMQAVGELRTATEAASQLAALQARGDDQGALRAAQAEAAARVRETENNVVRTQNELGEAAFLNPALPLPLPSTPPHIGPYRTHYDEVFAARGVSSKARLIHRVLPVRHRAIDVRASAVQAADDSLQATLDAYRAGHVDFFAVAAAVNQLAEQRRALLAAVADYNHDILEYAVMVGGPTLSNDVLVSMLVRVPGLQPAAGATPGTPAVPAVPGAGTTVPGAVPAMPGAAPLRPSTGMASPGSAVQPAGYIGPIDPEFPNPAGSPPPTFAVPSTIGVPGKAEPTLAPPRPRTPSADPAPSAAPPLAPEGPAPQPLPMEPVLRTAGRVAPGAAAGSPLAFYPGLVDAEPKLRVKQLIVALYTNRNLPGDAVQSVELAELLRSLLSVDRRGLVDAFWTAKQRQAQYQALSQQVELLEQMAPIALEHRNAPSGGREMLLLRAVQTAADADRLDTRVKLAQAQFLLTERTGRPVDSAWLSPVTVPHSGPYQLNLAARSGEAAGWPIRRLAQDVPGRYEALQQQAAAVVAADGIRADAAGGYQSSRRSIDAVVAAVEKQTQQTLAFIDGAADYNRAIAQYVFAVVPPTLPGDQLVQTLIVVR